MLTRAKQNLNKLPRDFDTEKVKHDLNLSAALESRLLRLKRVEDHITSAIFLADSDAFAAGLQVRRLLQDAGVSGVDDNLSEGLVRFFKRSSPTPAPAPPK